MDLNRNPNMDRNLFHIDEIIVIICYIVANGTPSLPMDSIRDGITWQMSSTSLVCKQWWKCMQPFITDFALKRASPIVSALPLINFIIIGMKDFIIVRRLESRLLENILTTASSIYSITTINKLCTIMKIIEIKIKHPIVKYDMSNRMIFNPNLRRITTLGKIPNIDHSRINDLTIMSFKKCMDEPVTFTYTASNDQLIIRNPFYGEFIEVYDMVRYIDIINIKRVVVITQSYSIKAYDICRVFINAITIKVYTLETHAPKDDFVEVNVLPDDDWNALFPK